MYNMHLRIRQGNSLLGTEKRGEDDGTRLERVRNTRCLLETSGVGAQPRILEGLRKFNVGVVTYLGT